MKNLLLLAALVYFSSCFKTKKVPIEQTPDPKVKNHKVPEFQSILDSAEVVGAILLYDFQEDAYYSNDFERAKEGKLPASTFKITNSIIGLETGVIESDTTMFKWDGEERGNENWERDLSLGDAFRFSCVPCYQEIARKIGSERMNDYLQKLDYGAMEVDSSNMDRFWLGGGSRISPMQQIDFLKRLYTSKLPISERTTNILRKIMFIEETEKYSLYGKTGLSNAEHGYNGWFVGYVEQGTETYFFATNIEPRDDFDFDVFVQKRMDITFAALKQMNMMGSK